MTLQASFGDFDVAITDGGDQWVMLKAATKRMIRAGGRLTSRDGMCATFFLTAGLVQKVAEILGAALPAGAIRRGTG